MYAIKTRNGDVYLKLKKMYGDMSALEQVGGCMGGGGACVWGGGGRWLAARWVGGCAHALLCAPPRLPSTPPPTHNTHTRAHRMS